MNRDGDIDILTADFFTSVQMSLNQGNGAFSKPVALTTTNNNPTSAVYADLVCFASISSVYLSVSVEHFQASELVLFLL